MKLIRYTLRKIALTLIPLVFLGAVFIYYAINFINYEEVDEYLTYEMQRIINHQELLGELPKFNLTTEIHEDVYHPEPFFKDTLILEAGEMEYLSYRELHFSIEQQESYDGIVLRHLMLGKDDIARGSGVIILALMIIFGFWVVIAINILTERIWQPFFKTLNAMKMHRLTEPIPDFDKSEIDEFNQLNHVARTMLEKIRSDFSRTKEFNENAAHELQTNLSVIKSANEELINTLPVNSEEMKVAKKAYSASANLSQIQRSLLLLSKIGNQEFQTRQVIRLDRIIEKICEDFSETIALRNIDLKLDLTPQTLISDYGLIMILIANLIKNSIKHNVNDGFISISLKKRMLTIENSTEYSDLDFNQLTSRYAKGVNGNWGLGLAIIKQICETYSFSLQTNYTDNKVSVNVAF